MCLLESRLDRLPSVSGQSNDYNKRRNLVSFLSCTTRLVLVWDKRHLAINKYNVQSICVVFIGRQQYAPSLNTWLAAIVCPPNFLWYQHKNSTHLLRRQTENIKYLSTVFLQCNLSPFSLSHPRIYKVFHPEKRHFRLRWASAILPTNCDEGNFQNGAHCEIKCRVRINTISRCCTSSKNLPPWPISFPLYSSRRTYIRLNTDIINMESHCQIISGSTSRHVVLTGSRCYACAV